MRIEWMMLCVMTMVSFRGKAEESWGGGGEKPGVVGEVAEMGRKVHPHLAAAERYEKKAEHLEEKAKGVDTEEEKGKLLRAARNFRGMAVCKREALEAEKQGRGYEWGEYHRMRGEAEELMKNREEGDRGEKEKGKGQGPVEKPEVAGEVAPVEEKPTKMKTRSGFEVKTRIGE